MRVSAEAHRVHIAQAEIAVTLGQLQQQHDLTNIEMMQAVNDWLGTKLKYMLRFERHGNHDTPADEDVSASGR